MHWFLKFKKIQHALNVCTGKVFNMGIVSADLGRTTFLPTSPADTMMVCLIFSGDYDDIGFSPTHEIWGYFYFFLFSPIR